MEHKNILESTFESLRNITDTELDALLHFDSPPPSRRFSNNSEQQRLNDNNAYPDRTLSILQFNREELPSQMNSQVGDINYFPDDLDLTLNFSQQASERPQSVIFNSPEVESIEVTNTEIQKPVNEGTQTEYISGRIQNTAMQIESFDEIVKKELMDLTIFENFSDDDFPTCKDVDMHSSPEQDALKAADSRQKRACQTQVDAPKQEDHPTKPIITSCPVPIRIEQSPALPSTISADDQMRLASSPANIQLDAVDYTFKTVDKSNPSAQCHENLQHSLASAASAITSSPACNLTTDTTMVPASVKQLYDLVRTQYSDFAFVYALSAQLCQDRVPMDCFVNLKMGLLLSLASISSNPDRPPVPIMAFGSDTYMANFLLTNIGQLAARFVGPSDDVKPPSITNYRNCNWIVADPILLAKDGVYFVGDWSRLKLTRADQLFRIIECSRVPLERSTLTCPLECAIWTHWRSHKGDARDQQTFNKVVKIFGIPICMDDDDKHEVLVDYILEQSSVNVFESTVDHLSISSDDMRCFLRTISKRTVDLTPEASLLLQKYFVTARFARPECLTKQAYVVLKQFAESFAKLCFRHEVLPCDVVAAVFMCERFIRSIFGVTENSPPAFESHNFVGTVDEHMVKFQDWLNAYIKKYEDK
ncbi:PREDICTED: uncharacterized protein LOC108368691 isoform X2 [Rhagoletis zephyria]|uniref:uncharacterized protein LOC108368691 isoform X2 n=1 Tax=Rhagoletis zephyria TaxID=28612 RepID=UPI0008114E23|nr:PREDICTED: uncharacterized protein LOC108368691 isoform X2 [Rhagoletis zephyria]